MKEKDIDDHSIIESITSEKASRRGQTENGHGRTPSPPGSDNSEQESESEEKPSHGDFDDRANALWSLYRKDARGHDEATIKSLKEDMDGVLLFAGLFATSLAAFAIDRVQTLQVSPTQQVVFYQQQSVALLSQISRQLSSLSAQASVPPFSLPPSPTPSPSPSEIRVNVFCLCAALLATLVQRWSRDYMLVFKRYRHCLKSARIRQYLHEGVEGWYMPIVAEAVPGLVHISLFLFLIGLGDFLLNANKTVGRATLFPITFCATLYLFSTFAPVFNPQSPYRSPFSDMIWYITWKLSLRKTRKDPSDGIQKRSPTIAEQQLRIAMEDNPARDLRDDNAILGLVKDLTQDTEMETLALAIPGYFDPRWAQMMEKNDAEFHQDEYKNISYNDLSAVLLSSEDLPIHVRYSPPRRIGTLRSSLNHVGTVLSNLHFPRIPMRLPWRTRPPSPKQRPNLVVELCKPIRHLFETCNNRGLFLNEDHWRRRSRACVVTAASFVLCTDAKLDAFGDITTLLGDLGRVEKTRELSPTILNRSFIIRWTCLSLVAIRDMLKHDRLLEIAEGAVVTLALSHKVDDDGLDVDELALRNAKRIDNHFMAAWSSVEKLAHEFKALGDVKGDKSAKDILRRHESDLAQVKEEADRMDRIDTSTANLQHEIDNATHNLTRQLPGVPFDDLTEPPSFRQIFDFLHNPVHPQLMVLQRRLQGLCSPNQGQNSGGRNSGGHLEIMKILKTIGKNQRSGIGQHRLMERQLSRLQDLRFGGALGFTVELYFLTLKQMLSAITSDWEDYIDSYGTQQVIFDLVCDIAVKDRGMFSNYTYPDYIKDELLKFLGKVIKGQTNAHIDSTVHELQNVPPWKLGDPDFLDKALTILKSRTSPFGFPV
ncbi:hypothetical protein B0F90DRAFT_1752615 [Multifurca ochricompacta]|uniref:DUF6535 domain-containing protein n=1 Tax=Multifurca ochricompacta TaxID=376703 RepID=A0AAD4M0I2_9AGAM|nr:hypothetical protein B0F90DRAFT_1752615 [Multifurca ochricompacta]